MGFRPTHTWQERWRFGDGVGHPLCLRDTVVCNQVMYLLQGGMRTLHAIPVLTIRDQDQILLKAGVRRGRIMEQGMTTARKAQYIFQNQLGSITLVITHVDGSHSLEVTQEHYGRGSEESRTMGPDTGRMRLVARLLGLHSPTVQDLVTAAARQWMMKNKGLMFQPILGVGVAQGYEPRA